MLKKDKIRNNQKRRVKKERERIPVIPECLLFLNSFLYKLYFYRLNLQKDKNKFVQKWEGKDRKVGTYK